MVTRLECMTCVDISNIKLQVKNVDESLKSPELENRQVKIVNWKIQNSNTALEFMLLLENTTVTILSTVCFQGLFLF